MKNKKAWETISSKVIHKNPWYKVRKDKFVCPSGKLFNYYVIDTIDVSLVVPVRDNKIIFNKQYRYPIGRWSLELPKGGVEDKKTFLLAAKDELSEEVGYESSDMKKIGSFKSIPGLTSDTCFVYLAKDLKFVGRELEESEKEAGMKTLEIEIKKVYEMIDDGKIIDGQTLAALSLARKYLLK